MKNINMQRKEYKLNKIKSYQNLKMHEYEEQHKQEQLSFSKNTEHVKLINLLINIGLAKTKITYF